MNADAALPFIVVSVFGFEFFLDAGGVNNDGCFSIDRTFVFADAAARAFFFFHDGAFLIITDDGMIGTLLVTDKADFFRIPGNTPCLIDMSNPHLEEALFLYGNGSDRFRGTNPSAKIAELLTIPNSGNEPWRIKT